MATAKHFYDLGPGLALALYLMWLFYSRSLAAKGFRKARPGSMQCKYTPPGNEESTCDTELLNTYIHIYVRLHSSICMYYTHTSLFLHTQYTILCLVY